MRNLTIAALVLAASLAAPAIAQTPGTTWQQIKDLNGPRGEAKVMKLAPNNDIVVAGFIPKPGSGTGRAQSDAWIARYASDGRELWSKTLGGPLRDEAFELDISLDGAILVTGARDIQNGRGSFAFAARFEADGKPVWETTVSDSWRSTVGAEIRALADGGALISGYERRGDEPGTWPLVVRLGSDGNIAWRANPRPPPDPNAPALPWGQMAGVAYSYDRGSLAQVHDDTIEFVNKSGYFPETRTTACLMISLTDGSDTGTTCRGAAHTDARSNNSFVGGSTASYGFSDAWVARLGPDEREIWRRTTQTLVGDGINAVAQTPDGGVVAAGYQLDSDQVEFSNWNGLLIRYDADGKELWRHKFGGSRRDEFNAVAVLPEGAIVVAGYTGSQPGPVEWAPWILRLNAQGELEGDALTLLKAGQF